MSYSHEDKDIAIELRYSLHRFAKKWFELRALRVFLDNAGMQAGGPVWDELRQALDASRFLILLASPAAARSEWVDREVGYWLTGHPAETLVIVAVSGTLTWNEAAGDFDWSRTDALPPELHGRYRQEPAYVDMRGLAPGSPGLADKVQDVAAVLHGVPKDVLSGLDVSAHRHLVRLQRAAIGILAALLALALATTAVAVTQRDDARAQTRLALSRELAFQSAVLLRQKIDLGMLLAVAAYRLDDTVQSRSALLGALMTNPPLRRTLRLPGAFRELGPDGDEVAVPGSAGVTVWNVASGHRLGPPFGSDTQPDLRSSPPGYRPVYNGALSPDGLHLATYTPRGNIQLWDLAPRRLLGTVPDPAQNLGRPAGPSSPVEPQLAYSPDGRYIVSTGFNGAYVFSATTLQMIVGPLVIPGDTATPDVLNAAFSPNGRLLVLSGVSTDNVIFDTTSWRQLDDLTNPLSASTMAFSPDGRQLALLSDFGVQVYDVTPAAGKRPMSVTGPVGTMDGPLNQYAVAWNSDGSLLATGGDDGTQIWNPATGKVVATLRVHSAGSRLDDVTSIAFDASGQHVITSGADGVVTWQLGVNDLEKAVVAGAGAIGPPAFSRNGKLVATADGSRGVELWNVASGKPAGPAITPGGGTAQSVAFGTAGRSLAIGEQVGMAIWDLQTGRQAGVPLTGFDHEVYDVAISRDGRYAAAAEYLDATIWNLATRRVALEIPMPATANGTALQVAISPDDKTVAVPVGTSVDLWSIATHRKTMVIPAGAPVNSVAFAPDGSFLAINTDLAATLRWDLDNQRWIGGAMSDGPFVADSLDDNPIAVSANSSLIASASGNDDTVTLWDTASGSQIGILHLPAGTNGSAATVNGLSFSPAGQTLAVTTTAGTLSLWNLDVRQWAAMACAIAGRELSNAEWQEFIGSVAPYQRLCG